MRLDVATLVLTAAITGCSAVAKNGLSNGGKGSGSTTTGGSGGASPGTPCSSNDACSSGACGVDGTGDCCQRACSTSDAICGAKGCDDAGACVYPAAGSSCGAAYCSAGAMEEPECDGAGSCSPHITSYCLGNRGCDDAGTGCLLSCASAADCAPGFACNTGACLAPAQQGICTENDDCLSGICGIAGTGHCCAAACSNVSTPCGSVDCDTNTGACLFADNTTVCVPAECVGPSTLQLPTTCDGIGSCGTTRTADCGAYACISGSCATNCGDDGGCAVGYACDLGGQQCCQLASGGTLWVSSYGDDSIPCCGTTETAPCLTIAHAMQMIDAAQARDVTIDIPQLAQKPSLASMPDSFPIRLGWGVTLSSELTVFYSVTTAPLPAELFDVGPYSANDTVGYATIRGNLQIGIGSDGTLSRAPSAIRVEPGETLYLLNTFLDSSAAAQTAALTLAPGAQLVIGADHQNVSGGGVDIQGGLANDAGYDGIVCESAGGLGCTIIDVPNGTSTQLRIEGQGNHALEAGDFSNVVLSAYPAFGWPAGITQFNGCSSKFEDSIGHDEAVWLHGTANLTFKNGSIRCVSGDAFRLDPSDAGGPTLVLDSVTIEGTERALEVTSGTATVTNSTIDYNYNGVAQSGDGVVDLASGGDAGSNTIVCNRRIESALGGTLPGISVLNASAAPLDADGVVWDWSGLNLDQCDPTITTCTCLQGSCNPGSGYLDAVETSTGSISVLVPQSLAYDCTGD